MPLLEIPACLVHGLPARLAYPPHVQGHPRGEDVELRVMPASGGAPRTVAAFHGGQGSINVPNWHPDGTRFAYMRYSRQAA